MAVPDAKVLAVQALRPNLESSLSRVCRAKELGITHLDTSDLYGPHTNEQLIGLDPLLAPSFMYIHFSTTF